MRRTIRAGQAKKERLNICLTTADRGALEEIADREDRDLGYLAAWFVRFGIEQYRRSGGSLVTLKSVLVNEHGKISKHATERLVLRSEAQRANDKNQEAVGQKRA